MDEASLSTQLQETLEANQALLRDAEQRQREFEALLDATKKLQDDRDRIHDLVEELHQKNQEHEQKIGELEAANRQLINMLWGRRTERRTTDPDQPNLFPEMDEVEEPKGITVDDVAQAKIDEELIKDWESRQQQRKKRRQEERSGESFPEHLERRERVLDLSDEEKAGLKYIGDAISERMRFERPHVYVERIIRRKYVVAGEPEAGVVSPPAPLGIVEGGRYGFDVIAAMLAQKYAFHQPTYRQQDWFAQCGWFPNRSTINDMLNHSVSVLQPLADQMWHRLLQQPVLQVDETTALVLLRDSLSAEQQEQLDKRRKKKKKPPDEEGEVTSRGSATSYAWLFTGLDDLAPYNYFQWTLSRSHCALDEWLSGYRGTVVADAYDAYVHIEKRTAGRIVHASCNLHARREFVKAEAYEPILCAEMISLYRHLYAIEERGQLLDIAGRLELRQRESVPVWNQIKNWLDSDRVQKAALPSSPFGKAVSYIRNQWDALRRYLRDGQLPIDNNHAERVIRPLTVGRKNWLFLAHPQAAAGRMQLISIISSAHRHNLIVEDYLTDVLEKLADAAQNNPSLLALESEYLTSLLPDAWAQTHAESIRHGRVIEKADRADAKRVRRARQRQQARDEKKHAAIAS